MPLLRSRGRKSLATSGFAGVYPTRQGIYTLSPETALLLRNKSTAKGVIYYGSSAALSRSLPGGGHGVVSHLDGHSVVRAKKKPVHQNQPQRKFRSAEAS